MKSMEELRDAVAARIATFTLATAVDVEAKPMSLLDVRKRPLSKPLVSVMLGSLTWEYSSRVDVDQQSKIVVNLYAKVPTNPELGEVDQVRADQATALIQELALKLVPGWLPNISNSPPPEVRRFFDPDLLLEDGILHGVLVVSFVEDME